MGVNQSDVVDQVLVCFGVLLVQTERRGFESRFEWIATPKFHAFCLINP